MKDQRDGVVGPFLIDERELAERIYADVEIVSPLSLVDLRGSHATAMGMPTDVHRGMKHTLGQKWSAAFHEHESKPDGIIYPSRLNGETNVAIYDRAISKLRAVRMRRLIDVDDLASVLNDLQIALYPVDCLAD
ncbi:hypothetical protein GCM10019059_42770 [Camelimonas fluminis]|nr:hypothetical protein GCM10019059_42770 [Camelimonas fluminis]